MKEAEKMASIFEEKDRHSKTTVEHQSEVKTHKKTVPARSTDLNHPIIQTVIEPTAKKTSQIEQVIE